MVVEWRDIEGFPRYQVSSDGQVRTVAPANGYKPMVLKYVMNIYGYGWVTLCHEGRRKRQAVHVLVCTAFHGPKPSPYHQVAHGDGNRLNNHYANLRWATPKENCADRTQHGTVARGSRNFRSKLTEADIPDIRALRAAGWTYPAIGERYGVTPGCIGFIIRRKNWRHAA